MASDPDSGDCVREQIGLGNRLHRRRVFGECTPYVDGKVPAFGGGDSLFAKPSQAVAAPAPNLPDIAFVQAVDAAERAGHLQPQLRRSVQRHPGGQVEQAGLRLQAQCNQRAGRADHLAGGIHADRRRQRLALAGVGAAWTKPMSTVGSTMRSLAASTSMSTPTLHSKLIHLSACGITSTA